MDWRTPRHVVDRVEAVGPILLDPCTSEDNPVDADRFFTPDDDGLKKSWYVYARGGVCYVNPPYGRELPVWTAKCRDQAALGCQIIALVPSRTDTRWWQECFADCAAVALWRGRITFEGAPSPAPFPSCLFYWGESTWLFERTFRDVARVIRGGGGV